MRSQDPGRGARGTIYWVNQFAAPPDQPGGTRHHEMSAALRELGYDVRVVASDLNLTMRRYARRADASDDRAIAENVGSVPFVWLPAGDYRRNDWRRAASMLVFAWQVIRYLTPRLRRGDIVIGSSPQLPAAAAARVAALVRGARFIFEVRDLWPESLTGVSGRRSALAALLRLNADALYRTSRAIIILAEGNRAPIMRHGGREGRIVFIPNGVDLTAFVCGPDDLPTEVAWVAEGSTFVYAGAHGPANGLDLVLDAADDLQRRDRGDIRILLIGDGPTKESLQREALQRGLANVVFADPVPKQAIPAILKRCTGGLMVLKDVELFRHGVSPNKLFDYLASDLPVVTNVPGDVATIVEEATAGIVVPPGDAQALADAMVAIAGGEIATKPGSAFVREHRDRRTLALRLARLIDTVAD